MIEVGANSLLIDQGLFHCLVRKGSVDAFQNFFEAPLLEKLFGSDPSKWSFTVSLPTILEAIGQKPPHLTNLVIPSSLHNAEPSKIIEWILQELREFYLSTPTFSSIAIKQAVEQQRKHCSSEGIKLFDLCITQIVIKPNFHESLIDFLGFDFIQKFDFPKNIRGKMHSFMTFFYIFNAPIKLQNASKFRLVKALWNSVYTVSRSRMEPAHQRELDAANSIIQLKNQSDYLDCDLVHHAVFGKVASTGATTRVHCFTLENIEPIRLRIRVYKGIIKLLQMELPPEVIGKHPNDLVSRANSFVIKCTEDGKPLSILDVTESAPAMF